MSEGRCELKISLKLIQFGNDWTWSDFTKFPGWRFLQVLSEIADNRFCKNFSFWPCNRLLSPLNFMMTRVGADTGLHKPFRLGRRLWKIALGIGQFGPVGTRKQSRILNTKYIFDDLCLFSVLCWLDFCWDNVFAFIFVNSAFVNDRLLIAHSWFIRCYLQNFLRWCCMRLIAKRLYYVISWVSRPLVD